ncbi:MAG: perosamine [Rhodospirillaceae bacterium]|nr:MAG: perosamine [Rhodospirillaceae bacterium]TNC97424.1 MAG: perosamine synthetase [Stygiobacter sp.]
MIPIFEPEFTAKEREYLLECIDTGWISSQGRFITDFEQAYARHTGMPHGIATSNCTTALHLALLGLGIGAGDEVICPDLTFIAPANMIAMTGATPVLVDVEPIGWGIDPQCLEARITPRTKAVIVVHAFGHAANMGPIMAIARRHGLKVIEDVAEAPDAQWIDPTDGSRQRVGTFGDASCYSFFANKIMTCGEGGMILCHDADLAENLRILRDHGMSRQQRYVHDVIGTNYRMTNMQAAVALAQLERLDDTQARRLIQCETYRRQLSGCAKLSFRPVAAWCAPVHWLTTITLRRAELRTPLSDYLRRNGVEPRPMIFPVHEAKPYRHGNDPNDFPVSRSISHRSLHLPSAIGLSAEDIARICDLVIDWVERNDA